MTTRTQTQGKSKDTRASTQASSGATALGFAVIGCLVAGVVGILMATSMRSGFDVLCCLLASVAAFGLVFHIYLRRD